MPPKTKIAKKKVAKAKTAKRKKNTKTDTFYVDPVRLKEDIRAYYVDGAGENSICEDLKKIAEKLSYSPSFIRYSYREDMVGDALYKMYVALKNHKFDPDAGTSPFSYFTTTAFRAFINRIKKEKKSQDTITAYRESVFDAMMSEEAGGSVYVRPFDEEDEMFEE